MHRTPHGARRRRLAAALSLGILVPLATALLAEAPAAAAPPAVDLVVSATAIAPRDQVVDVGGGVTVEVDVRNAGRKSAADVTLTYGLPAGASFTDGNAAPEGWTCDFREAARCTYGALAAGASAPRLRFDFYFPPAPAGTTSAVTATARTSSTEFSTTNNVDEAAITYIRGVTDLEVTDVQASPAQVIVGNTVNFFVEVRNTGNMTAEEVHVTVPLPEGFQRVEEPYSSPWYCQFGTDPASGQPAWDCTVYGLVAGYPITGLWLTASVVDGAPGDVATITARATTNSPEDDISDNTGQATVTIMEPATVRGTVWLDANRNGVRDADESGVTGAEMSVWVRDDQTGQTSASATVAGDGTWTAKFRPGGLVADLSIRSPFCFTAAVDDDLAGYQNDSYGGHAWSNPVTVAAGGEVVIDAAVTRC
jgi:uncharacterized repeat protein (TIGR01451 family)